MNKKIQILRAAAIIAVVLIHTCPGGIRILIRPLINFPVALFIFLSGYLTKVQGILDLPKLYTKRIFRVLLPYIVWTLIYTYVSGHPSKLLFNLITTKANYVLYYIFVYVQIVLLTPVVIKLAKSRYQWIGWFIQPVALILFRYLPLAYGFIIDTTWISINCFMWFSYYYLGIVLGNGLTDIVHISNKRIILLYGISLLIQYIEGFGWYFVGNYDMATTQIKISTMLSSMCFCCMCYKFITSNIQSNTRGKNLRMVDFLSIIGDCSFGIYLLHPLIIYLFKFSVIYTSIIFPVNFIIIFLCSLLIVFYIGKIPNKRIVHFLGMR